MFHELFMMEKDNIYAKSLISGTLSSQRTDFKVKYPPQDQEKSVN